MIHALKAPRTLTNARAERCAACNRAMHRDNATDIPYIGLVGPECRSKFGPLLAAIEAAGQIRATADDQGSMRLTRYVLFALQGCGLEVRVVNIDAETKGLEVVGLRRKAAPAGVVQSYAERRAEFEQTLRLAAAEREAQGWVAA